MPRWCRTHTLIPGECRHGSKSYQTPDGKRPKKLPATSSDPVTDWRREARKKPLDGTELEFPEQTNLSPEDRVYWKAALLQTIQDALAIFSEAIGTNTDYQHWVTDQTLLAIFRGLLCKTMYVKGIKVCLRPWTWASPSPQLSMHSAPLRLQIRGTVKHWIMDEIQDLTTCSASQIEEAIDIDDWQITIFGKDLQAGKQHDSVAKSSPKTPITTSPATPAPTTPTHTAPASAASSSTTSKAHSQPPTKTTATKSRAKPPSTRPNASHDTETTPTTSDQLPSPPPLQEQPQQEDQSTEDQPYEEEEEFHEREITAMKPLYDFRKVFQRLPQLAKEKPQVAERLLLGLHEKYWHAPPSDMKNLLAKTGMPVEVLNLVGSAVMKCQICRKYVRLPNRPQLKLHNAGTFNQCIQADLFKLLGKWIFIIVDEATRYKVAVVTESRELQELQQKLLEHWMRFFGPPASLVMDQESSLMSHEAAAEFERLNIERKPKGTTAGHAGHQHTGTGLVERHVGLMKLTMLKLKAELDRQGVSYEVSELAMESAMAHNSTLNYNGVTPAMAVFGVLPRGFYDDESNGILASAGALQTDLTTFEKALRIRQMSLSAVQQAIVEDRTARANRTRSHRLDTTTLVPGTSEIEFYRDMQGDVGWRGPALLLRLDADEGTAVIQYQGRPYLVAIRHIRPHVQTFLNQNNGLRINDKAEDELFDIMKHTEMVPPNCKRMLGHTPHHTADGVVWRTVPGGDHFDQKMFDKVNQVSLSLTTRACSGMIYGRSLKFVKPPRNTTGYLITWITGSVKHHIQEHWSDHHIKMKKISNDKQENICMIYLYFHVVNQEEETRKDLNRSRDQAVPDANAPLTTTPAAMSVDDNNMNDDQEERGTKRESPDSRTVVIAPEKKRSRVDYWTSHSVYYNSSSLHYLLDKKRLTKMDFPDGWTGVQQWAENKFASDNMEYLNQKNKLNKDIYLFHIGSSTDAILHVDLRTSDVWKVDTNTDDIGEEDVYSIWSQVEEADKKELLQFVQEGAFKKRHVDSFRDEVIIDARWVRKWKIMANGQRQVKSRLCARGCLDRQKDLLTTRSTTATRLSQRLLLSTAATFDLEVESWDIAGAFLKGLNFNQIRKMLLKRGIHSPVRVVIVIPPLNVWRHLALMSKDFDVRDASCWGLECVKPIYGLNDAPLAWQLCLQEFLRDIGGVPSSLDENSWRWKHEDGSVQAVCTCHVDDIAIAAPSKWLEVNYKKMVDKFKKVTRQQLPFTHCGAKYERIPDGFRMMQREFCEKIRPAEIAEGRKDGDRLTIEEVTSYRSILGALLWLTATRLDLTADVSHLATHVTAAEIKHLRQANAVLKRAQGKDYSEVGLYFRKLDHSHGLRLACFHDSSSFTKDKAYAHEGVLVMLMEDHLCPEPDVYEITCSDEMVQRHGGRAHILWSHGAKAKRISYSTSHAETLAAISGHEAAVLVNVRISEMLHTTKEPTLQQLAAIQEAGNRQLPVDDYGDCNDVYQLVTGCKTLPQDKSQRIYVLSLRESRLAGRMRWVNLVPTRSMAADAFTKPMLSPQLMILLSTGILNVENEATHPVQMKRLPPKYEIEECDLTTNDEELITKYDSDIQAEQNMWWAPTFMAYKKGTIPLMMLMVLSSLPTADAVNDTEMNTDTEDAGSHYTNILMIIFAVVVIVIERLCARVIATFGTSCLTRVKRLWSSIHRSRTTPSTETWTPDEHEQAIWNLERKLRSERKNVFDLNMKNAELEERNKQLKREINQVNKQCRELIDENKALKDRSSASSEPSRSKHTHYIVTPAGECLHVQNCPTLYNSKSLRKLTLCQRCCG